MSWDSGGQNKETVVPEASAVDSEGCEKQAWLGPVFHLLCFLAGPVKNAQP